MARPSTLPEWATSTNYDSGPDTGQATRLEPTSGEKANGWWRGLGVPARKLNWLFGLLCDWVGYVGDVTEHSACYGVVGALRAQDEIFELSATDGFEGAGFQLSAAGAGHEVQVPAAGTYLVSIYGPLAASVSGSVVRRGVEVSPATGGPSTRLSVTAWRPTTDNSDRLLLSGSKPIEITDPSTQRLRVRVIEAPSGTVTAVGDMFLSIVRIA